ncbi:organic cation transporter protein-like [Glandiceps talaboti]
MQFDDILKELGEFGRYQKWIYFLICLASIPSAMVNLGNSFLSASDDHYCRVYDNQTYDTSSPLTNCTIPYTYSDDSWDMCTRYDLNMSGGISRELCYPRTGTIDCDDGWVYDRSTYENTVVFEFDLVCTKDWMKQLSKSIVPVGNLVGALVCGQVADLLGRKPTFFTTLIMALIVAIVAAFSPGYLFFIICQFLLGITSTGMYLVGFVLGVELVGVKYRTASSMIICIFFAVGYMLLAIIAYAVNGNWRKIQLIEGLMCIIYIPYYWLITESVRWLILKEKYDEAEKILKKAAKVNKVTLTENIFQEERELKEKRLDEKVEEIKTEQEKNTMLDLLKTPNLRIRTINICFQWFTASFVYYGLALNTDQLGVDPYTAFLIAGVVEIPSYLLCWWLLDKTGRRWLQCLFMVFGGVSLIISVPPENANIGAALATVGKFFAAGAFAIVYIFTAEIFPTTVRNAGMGMASTAARIGSIISPYVMLLIDVWYPLPYVLMGVTSILAGLVALFLPETLGEELPATMEEGEIFGTKLWDERKKIKESPEKVDAEHQVDMDKDSWTNEREMVPMSDGVVNPSFKEE